MSNLSTEIPYTEPLTITAGNTVKWKKALDYSAADSWVLTYNLRGPSQIDITADADGANHSITLSATTTAAYTVGDYWWTSFVTKSGERFSVGSGRLTIEENVARINKDFDGRTPAKRILDAHMTAYEGRASRPESDYRLEAAGRSFSYKSDGDMIKAIQFWQAEVKRETDAEKIALGLGTGKNIFVRFGG